MKLFYFSPAILVDLFKNGNLDGVRCTTPLPADARLVRVFIDYAYAFERVGLVIASPSFDAVVDGELIPEARLTFEKVAP